MPQKVTPRRGEGLRNDLAINFRKPSTSQARQVQILRCRYGVRPILAGVLAALIFGEADHG
jgi:hypothetical protein